MVASTNWAGASLSGVPYPEDSLHPNEDLVLDLHPHWWFIAKSVIVVVAAVIFGVVVLAIGLPDPVKVLAALVVLGSLVWFLDRYARWVTIHFVLTSDRVIYRSGLVAKRGIEIPLENINAIHFEQRVFERLLGLGDLKIDSASIQGFSVFDDIQHPDKVQNEIYLQMEANDQRRFRGMPGNQPGAPGAPAAPAPPVLSVPEQLEKLSELRDRGVITDEEFQAKKTELLGRM